MSTTEQAARPLLPPRLLRFFRMIALLRESPIAMTGVGIILFWVVVAVFAPLLAPFDPNATLQPFARPGTAYAAGHGTFRSEERRAGEEGVSTGKSRCSP